MHKKRTLQLQTWFHPNLYLSLDRSFSQPSVSPVRLRQVDTPGGFVLQSSRKLRYAAIASRDTNASREGLRVWIGGTG